ncbi:MAG: hypothetical protein ACOCX3_01915 [Chloroflexota bacterium]
MKQTVVWVHGDCLSPYGPSLQAAPGSPAIFVFDDDLLRDWAISLKRIAFIYECLLELPVIIRRGDVAEQVVQFAHEHAADRILTTDSPSPRFDQIARRIVHSMPSGSRLEVYKVEPLIAFDGSLDLKRFSRYWRTARKYAFP